VLERDLFKLILNLLNYIYSIFCILAVFVVITIQTIRLMILSPTDYTKASSKKNNIWLNTSILSFLFIFIFSNSYAQAPVQDTIPAKKISGRVFNLEDSTPLSGASVVNLRTNHGTVTSSAGVFSIEAKAGDSIRFSFAGRLAQTIAYFGRSCDHWLSKPG
jgi:carboxypeptidase-like protein